MSPRTGSTMPQATGVWSSSEHERFLEAIALYPNGPWSLVTAHIGTRSCKQVQTHAQKYQHKLQRHRRGLQKRKTRSSRLEHRVDTATAARFTDGFTVHIVPRPKEHESPQHPGSSTVVASPANCNIKTEQAHINTILPTSLRSLPHMENATVERLSGSSKRQLCCLDAIEPMPFSTTVASPSEPEEFGSWEALVLLLAGETEDVAIH